MMVSFNWSWADYEREKRAEERRAERAARKAAPVVDLPDRVAESAPVDDDEDDDAITVAAQLQHCDACGKRRIQRCDFGGCPLL